MITILTGLERGLRWAAELCFAASAKLYRATGIPVSGEAAKVRERMRR